MRCHQLHHKGQLQQTAQELLPLLYRTRQKSEPLLMEINFTIAVMLEPLGTFQIRSVYRWCTTKVQKIYLQTAKLLDIFSIRERGAGGDKKIYNTLRVTIPYHQGTSQILAL